MLNQTDKRAEAARRIAEHVAGHLQADLSLKLWDGTVVPLGPGARSDILLCIRSPAAIRRMIFSPKLMTIFELYATGDLDIEGGSPLEAARRWDHLKALRLPKKVDKRLILKSLWPFLRSRAGSDGAAHRYRGPNRDSERRSEKELIQFHYDVSNAFYALFLDREMLYSSAYFARPDMTLDDAPIAKLDYICRRLRLKPGERILDVGCGWGGFLCHAARNLVSPASG